VDAAQILVMEHGRIVESGTHNELLALDRVYAQMWARQQAQPELDLWADEAPQTSTATTQLA
jgi:ABC-type transport system involved in cytochrome bd biosynthesis fused ATPase/permease subunit